MRLYQSDASFDGHADDDDDDTLAPAGYLSDPNSSPAFALEAEDWSSQSNNSLYHAMQRLDERSQEILQARWLNEKKATLQDLATRYSVSAERIRQLEQNAMQKLRALLEEKA